MSIKKEKAEIVYTIIAKDSSWFAKVKKEQLDILIEEQAVVLKPNKETTYQTTFTEKELKKYIRIREKESCVYCEKKADTYYWLLPKDEGGHETPINLVFACEDCIQEQKHLKEKDETEYMKNIRQIKKRNALLLQEKRKIQCDGCQENKGIEQFKFINYEHEYGYCQKCYKKSGKDVYFVLSEANDYKGKEEKEEIQKLWEEGKIEYIDKNIVKIFKGSKKQRCLLCNKMKWKNSFRKNQKNERKQICRKCQIEKATEGLVSVINYKNEYIHHISSDEAHKLAQQKVGKLSSTTELKINSLLKTIMYQFKLFYMEKVKNEKNYIAISLKGDWSMKITRKEMDDFLNRGRAESHNKYVIRIIAEETTK